MRNNLPTKRGEATDGGELGCVEDATLPVQEEVNMLRDSLPSFILNRMLPIENDTMIVGCKELLAETVDGVSPRDPLERMLVQQLLWCQQRVAHLSMQACKPANLKQLWTINELADRAMNSDRRGMLALREYRAPHRQVNITAVKQLNQAEQQNIVQAESLNSNSENVASEQDANHGYREANPGQPTEPKALEGTHPGRA